MDEALRVLQEYLSSVPYCIGANTEGHYQQLLYIIFTLMGYYVEVEVHTCDGRVDAVIHSKDRLYLIELKIDRSYYATAGYTFQLRNPLLCLKTSAIGRTDGVMYRADVTARLVYTSEKRCFYGGLSYSPTNSVTALLGMQLRGVNIGYSYEYYTTGLNPGNGSHELFVGYQMNLNLGKKGKNLHKAVRIL